jgi:hypothetical protein
LATLAETTNLAKRKQITFHRGDFMYHRLRQTAWLAPKESNIYELKTSRHYFRIFHEHGAKVFHGVDDSVSLLSQRPVVRDVTGEAFAAVVVKVGNEI